MYTAYLPILVIISFGVLLGLIALSLGYLISPHNPYQAKQAPYECGFPAVGDARLPFDIRYYRIAILFILFDLETLFFFPWALSLREVGRSGLLAMLFFIGILTMGFLYELKKGALEWI